MYINVKVVGSIYDHVQIVSLFHNVHSAGHLTNQTIYFLKFFVI